MLLVMVVLVMLSVWFVRRQFRRQQRTVELELVTFTSSTEAPTPSLPLPPSPSNTIYTNDDISSLVFDASSSSSYEPIAKRTRSAHRAQSL